MEIAGLGWRNGTGLIYDKAMDFMTPEAFDILIVGNIVIGLVLAGRRLRRDLRAPRPADIPAAYDSPAASPAADS